MISDTIDLGISLLRGGNIDVQKVINLHMYLIWTHVHCSDSNCISKDFLGIEGFLFVFSVYNVFY